MSQKFEGRYSVNDGYAGKSRPHHFQITAEELTDDMDDAALESLYEACVQDHFEQNITPSAESADEFIEWAKEQIAARAAR